MTSNIVHRHYEVMVEFTNINRLYYFCQNHTGIRDWSILTSTWNNVDMARVCDVSGNSTDVFNHFVREIMPDIGYFDATTLQELLKQLDK